MRWAPIIQDEAEKFRQTYKEELRSMALFHAVQEFFTYLDYTEESDSGRSFHPVQVSSCRVMLTEPVSMVLERMRDLTNLGGSK